MDYSLWAIVFSALTSIYVAIISYKTMSEKENSTAIRFSYENEVKTQLLELQHYYNMIELKTKHEYNMKEIKYKSFVENKAQ